METLAIAVDETVDVITHKDTDPMELDKMHLTTGVIVKIAQTKNRHGYPRAIGVRMINRDKVLMHYNVNTMRWEGEKDGTTYRIATDNDSDYGKLLEKKQANETRMAMIEAQRKLDHMKAMALKGERIEATGLSQFRDYYVYDISSVQLQMYSTQKMVANYNEPRPYHYEYHDEVVLYVKAETVVEGYSSTFGITPAAARALAQQLLDQAEEAERMSQQHGMDINLTTDDRKDKW